MTGTQHYDLIIIGGGPAGQGAAEFAAFAGRRILVIEREDFCAFSKLIQRI